MGLTRTQARFIRHAVALAVSVALMGAVAALWSHLPVAGGAGVGESTGAGFFGAPPERQRAGWALPWPWLVFGLPGLFSLPLALVFEWFASRRQVRPWAAPLLLVPLVAVVWALAQGLDGRFEGAVSVLGGLPAGLFCAASFTTYWLPLWLVRLWLRRVRRTASRTVVTPATPATPGPAAGR